MISFGGHTATGGGVMLGSKESMFVTIPVSYTHLLRVIILQKYGISATLAYFSELKYLPLQFQNRIII